MRLAPRRWLRGLRELLLGLVLVGVLAGCGELGTNLPRSAPDLSGSAIGGGTVALEEFEGQVVLVTAWASWCAPCREEVPVLNQAQQRLGAHGFQVVGMNVKDRGPAAEDFAQRYPMGYPSVADDEGVLAVDWGVGTLPESFLVDREGQIVALHFGAVDEEWVQAVVVPEVTG